MATTVYGGTTNHWRAFMTYTAGSTNNDTTYAVNISAAGIQSQAWGFAIDYVDCSLAATGQTTKAVYNQSFSAASGSTTSKSLISGTFSWTKGHSESKKTITVTTKNHSGYMDGTSSKSITVTVPVKTHYTVSYNANGGSGAPSNQTKWYGEDLTLSTTKPTRADYTFLGWATSSTATTASYAAGATYSANGALSLYAVWKRNYIAPTITSLGCYRSSDATGTAADDGERCYLTCGWNVDTTIKSDNKGSTLAIKYRLSTASSWTDAKSVTLSGNNGTTSTAIYNTSNALVTFDTSKSYVFQVTVSDTSGQSGNTASRTTTLSQAYFTIDFRSGGHGLGVGHSADVEGVFRIGMDVQIDGYADSSNYDRGNFACVDPRLPQNDAADKLESTWGNGLFFYPPTDFNDEDIGNPIFKSQGYIRGINLLNGWRGVQVEAQRYVDGARKTTPLNLTVDSAGVSHATLGGVDIFMTHGHVGQDTTTAANSYKDFTVNFNHTYSSPPHVIATMYSTSTSPTMGSIQVAVTSVSNKEAKIRIFNNTNGGRSPGFYWLAIGN